VLLLEKKNDGRGFLKIFQPPNQAGESEVDELK